MQNHTKQRLAILSRQFNDFSFPRKTVRLYFFFLLDFDQSLIKTMAWHVMGFTLETTVLRRVTKSLRRKNEQLRNMRIENLPSTAAQIFDQSQKLILLVGQEICQQKTIIYYTVRFIVIIHSITILFLNDDSHIFSSVLKPTTRTLRMH